MLILQNIFRFLIWLFFLILGDFMFRSILIFVLSSDFKQGHEFRELLLLRTIESVVLLILTRHELMSIFGGVKKFKKELMISTGFCMVLILGFWLIVQLFDKVDVSIIRHFLVIPENRHFDLELLIIAVIAGPLLEEFCFRGILWNTLSQNIQKLSLKIPLLGLCALPFVLLHINLTIPLSSQIPLILMWSTCAVSTLILFEWRKSILCGFALHACANAAIYFGHHLIP